MTERIKKVNQLIKREISQLLLREADFPKGVLVTVTEVETSPDLRQSKVYISTLPEERNQEISRILSHKIYYLQQKLNKRLKMRIIPKIRFIEEEKTIEASRVEELLKKIKNE